MHACTLVHFTLPSTSQPNQPSRLRLPQLLLLSPLLRQRNLISLRRMPTHLEERTIQESVPIVQHLRVAHAHLDFFAGPLYHFGHVLVDCGFLGFAAFFDGAQEFGEVCGVCDAVVEALAAFCGGGLLVHR